MNKIKEKYNKLREDLEEDYNSKCKIWKQTIAIMYCRNDESALPIDKAQKLQVEGQKEFEKEYKKSLKKLIKKEKQEAELLKE